VYVLLETNLKMYREKIKKQGFSIQIRKDCEDNEGYDLYVTISKGDSYSETFYSMSNSKGYYFTYDNTNCSGDGCNWDFDIEKIVCEFLEVEKLKEIV
jgi:hypothetical protein